MPILLYFRKSKVKYFGSHKLDFCRILSGDLSKMFVVKVLKKIFADKDVKRSHLAQLSKACETALGIMLFNLGIKSFVPNFD